MARTLLGAMPSGDMVLRTVLPGYDVLDDTLAPEVVTFDSRFRALKVLQSGIYTVTSTTANIDPVATFPDRGYLPLALIDVLDPSGSGQLSGWRNGDRPLLFYVWRTKITYQGQGFGYPNGTKIRWLIFENPLVGAGDDAV